MLTYLRVLTQKFILFVILKSSEPGFVRRRGRDNCELPRQVSCSLQCRRLVGAIELALS